MCSLFYVSSFAALLWLYFLFPHSESPYANLKGF